MKDVPESEIARLRVPFDPQSDHTGYRFVYRCNTKDAYRVKLKLHAGSQKSEYLRNTGTYRTPREAAYHVVHLLRHLYGDKWWESVDVQGNERLPVVDAVEVESGKWCLRIWMMGSINPVSVLRDDGKYFSDKHEALVHATPWLEREFPLFGHYVLGRRQRA